MQAGAARLFAAADEVHHHAGAPQPDEQERRGVVPSEDAIDELEDNWFDWTLEDRSAIKAWLRSYRPDREPDEQSGPRPVDSSGAEETLAPAD